MGRLVFRLFASILLAAPLPGLAQADPPAYADGLAAYDAGLYRQAAEIWSQLAREGDAAAMVSLAGLYDAGSGVPRDAVRALGLYHRAAALGDPVARRILRERGIRE